MRAPVRLCVCVCACVRVCVCACVCVCVATGLHGGPYTHDTDLAMKCLIFVGLEMIRVCEVSIGVGRRALSDMIHFLENTVFDLYNEKLSLLYLGKSQ